MTEDGRGAHPRRERYRLAMAAPTPYGGFRSRWTRVGAVTVHERVRLPAVPGVPVVLVHGLSMSHRYSMPLARALAEAHPVSAVDLPGFGLSGKPEVVLDVPALADALGAWLRLAGTPAPVLVGHSVGCQIVADLAARDPAVARAVVLIGPTMDPHARTALRQALRWLRDVRHEDLLQLPVLARDVLAAGVGRTVGTFRHALRDRIERKLPAVDMPALVVRGTRDRVVSAPWAAEAAALLPRGELAVIPGAPHDGNYTAPAAVATAVLPFLARQAVAAPRRAG